MAGKLNHQLAGQEAEPSLQGSLPSTMDRLTEQRIAALGIMARFEAKSLYYFIFKRLGNAHEAQDLMQQTFEEALRCIDTFEENCTLSTWVYGIAANLLRNHLNRSPSRVYEFESDDVLDNALSPDLGPDELVGQARWLGKLGDCLERLPEDLKATFLLVMVEDASYAEVAEIFMVPVGTIRSRMCRARKLMKDMLDDPVEASAKSRATMHQTIPQRPGRDAAPLPRIPAEARSIDVAIAGAALSPDQIEPTFFILKAAHARAYNALRKGCDSTQYSTYTSLLAAIQVGVSVLQRDKPGLESL